jgi:hypothetical protein
MTIKRTYLCSICNIERKETNRWFVAVESLYGLKIMRWKDANAAVLNETTTQHLCGQACMHKLLDRFLAKE